MCVHLSCFRNPVFHGACSQSPLARIILLPTLPQCFLSPEAGDIPVMNVCSKFFHILNIVCLRVFLFVLINYIMKALKWRLIKYLNFKYSLMTFSVILLLCKLIRHNYVQFYTASKIEFQHTHTHTHTHTDIYANIYRFNKN